MAPNVPLQLGMALASSCTLLALHSCTTVKETLQPSVSMYRHTQSYTKQCQNFPQNMTRHWSVPPLDRKKSKSSPPQTAGGLQRITNVCTLSRYILCKWKCLQHLPFFKNLTEKASWKCPIIVPSTWLQLMLCTGDSGLASRVPPKSSWQFIDILI